MLLPQHQAAGTTAAKTTVGQTDFEQILEWAEYCGVGAYFANFVMALRVRTGTQYALFGGTMNALEGIAPILRRWDLGRSNTHGLAALAAAWRQRPPQLLSAQARSQIIGTRSMNLLQMDLDERLLDRSRDAMYVLWEAPFPPGADDAPHRCLRAWALLHAVRLAQAGHLPDKLLATACQALTIAARETESRDWRDLLAPFGAPADSWEVVNSRFDARSGGYLKVPAAGRHKSFLAAAGRLARGDNDSIDEEATAQDDASTHGRLAILALAGTGTSSHRDHIDDADDLGGDLELWDGPGPEVQVDREDFAEHEITCIEVDPEATTAEHQLQLQSLQLRLGAAARFLPWGSWDSLTPPESEALRELTSSTLANPADAAQQLLAAMVHVALGTGMSLERVASLPIAQMPVSGAAWSIDLTAGRLIRTPPRHVAHWKPRLAGRSLTTPAQAIAWPIDRQALDALRSAASARPGAAVLGQLRVAPTLSLRREFRAWVQGDRRTARIEGGFLASALGPAVFRNTRDAVLARLMGTVERQTLPPSTVYTAYLDDAVRAPLPGMVVLAGEATQEPCNVAGSLLDPVGDDLLQCAFAQAESEIDEHKKRGDWIEFHNAVALHWDAALRAATGARPVNDLWKSALEFDWEHAEVFVDDKASPFGETGRLIPLPRRLCAAFKADYVERHLPWVLRQLQTHGAAAPSVPSLLFAIRPRHGGYVLEGIQNRDRSRGSERIYEGRLPLNLFRHRLRTRLHRRSDLDLEIVDTIMGHRDGATLTHGGYTMRVWRRDAEAIRPALEAIFVDLYFKPPPLWQDDLPSSLHAARSLPPLSARAGATGRAERARAGGVEALELIRKFIREQATRGGLTAKSAAVQPGDAAELDALLFDICELSEDQFDQLSQRLLQDESGMPAVQGGIRYERLIELAGDAWTRIGRRARIRKRYSARLAESSTFTPLAPRASERVEALRQALEGLFEAAPIKSELRLSQALVLAVYDLLLVGRLGHADLLGSVIADDASWRVVRLRDCFHLEWSPSEDLRSKPQAPVQRFTISLRCAWLLLNAIRGKTRRLAAWSAGATWASNLAAVLRPDAAADAALSSEALLAEVVALVNQSNATQMPGTVAAYLGGRVLSPSLAWGDWLRLTCGRWVTPALDASSDGLAAAEGQLQQRIRLADLPEEDPDEEIEIVSATRYARQTASEVAPRGPCVLADGAHALFAKLRARLNHLKEDQQGARHRALTADAMVNDIGGLAPAVSSAVHLLGLWAIELLLRPGRSRKLATSSVLRYFGALSPRFQAMGYDVELDALDSDEIEAFYAGVLADAKVENLKDIHDGLRNFHLFASTAAGLPEIDWSVLGVPDDPRLGSPGWVDDETYLALVHRLGEDHSLLNISPWQLQCLAIVARRFGLRGGEAAGLRRNDLLWGHELESVIVRNNWVRTLKTAASRRVVPLVYELADIERKALKTLEDFHAAESIGLKDAPLFGLEADPKEPIDGLRARARINEHLKALTGQPASTLHKLRKSFAIDLWAAIEAPESTSTLLPALTPQRRARITETLLGRADAGVTRRGLWAVASALGHAGCSVSLRSYVAILSDAVAWHVDVVDPATPWHLTADSVGALRLDTDLADFAPQQTPAPSADRRATPLAALRALLHLSQGRSTSAAAEYAGLPFEVAEDLQMAAASIHSKLSRDGALRPKAGAAGHKSNRLATEGLLSLVHVNAHRRLREGLASIPSHAGDRLRRIPSIKPSEWWALVGPRREISMWRPAHFELAAMAAGHLVARSRLVIEMPPLKDLEAKQRVVSLATSAGWLPEAQGATPALCRSLGVSSRLPRVAPAGLGITIDARAVMRLTGASAADQACDGVEMAVALLCLNACTAHLDEVQRPPKRVKELTKARL